MKLVINHKSRRRDQNLKNKLKIPKAQIMKQQSRPVVRSNKNNYVIKFKGTKSQKSQRTELRL